MTSAMQEAPSTQAQYGLTVSAPRLAYSLSGPRDGACVALLHGVGSSSATWHELTKHLGGELSYVAADYRGHGASEWGDMPYRLEDFVGDHFRLTNELDIDAVHIVGFSIGAVFAQAIAIADPDRTLSLTLLNSIGGRTEEEKRRALARLEMIRTTPPAEVARGSVRRWFTEAFTEARPDLVDAERAIIAATAQQPYAASYEVLATTDRLDEAHRITAPTLIVTGEMDEGSTPEMSRKLHARIDGSRLHIRPGMKHYLHVEDAEAIGALITEFVREVA